MSTPAAPLLSEADFEAIEAAVMETARGRWFLAEYARRNRHADTTMLIAALDRIEGAIRGERSLQSVDRIRFDLVEMAKAIARTKAEIAAIKPDGEQHGKFGEATAELDSIVQATESATSSILATAEQIQEIAWTLREHGLENATCDLLDGKAIDVYTACSFQDLTGQRTRKVIQVLHYLEGRINAMIGIWGLDGAMAAEAAETARTRMGQVGRLNGPTQPGHGLDQADVDMVMGPADAAAEAEASAPVPAPHAPVREPQYALADHAAAAPAMAAAAQPYAPAAPHHTPHSAPAVEATPARREVPALPRHEVAAAAPARSELGPMAKAMAGQSDPLAAVTALSFEEKVALFS